MKKKLSLLLSAVMLLASLFSIPAYADFSDVPDTNKYRNAIITLSKLETASGQKIINGYEDGTFKPEGAITRAEFAKIIVSVLNYADIKSSGNRFTDIDSHWAKDVINICADFGIINGMGDGTFAPDSQVTYEQAIKMIVCALGYGPVAETLGGYPSGYITEASELSLLDKISDIAFTSPAPRGVIAQAVYNSLDVVVAETAADGVTSKTEKTLMEDYLKIKKLKGTLAGVSDYKTAECTAALGKGLMDIVGASDGKEYIINYTTYTDDVTLLNPMLGKTITVYYRQLRDGDDMDLIIVDDETTKNNIIELSSEDIISYDGSVLRYYDGSSSKEKTLRANINELSVRYNGKLVPRTDNVTLTNIDGSETVVSAAEAIKEWLDSTGKHFIYGNIRVVDNEADGTINMVEIFNYETLVAYSKPTTADYRIQDKLKTAHYLILDPDDVDYSFTITKDGKSINTTDISANDILLYAKSLDGELYTVYVTAKTVTGSISSINKDFSTVTISDKSYGVSDICKDYMANVAGKELKLGISGTFYIDMFDTIVFANVSEEAESPYGYIASAALDEAGDEVYITAYLPSSDASTAKTYSLESRVRIDGTSMQKLQVIDALRKTAANSNKDVDIAAKIYGANKTPTVSDTSQLARVKLSSSGKISEIITLSADTYDDSGEVVEGTRNEDSSKLVRYRSLGKYYYTSSSFKESSSSSTTLFTTNSSTNVIYVPMDRNDRTSYSKKAPSSAFTSGESYYVEAYNVNASKVASLIVLYRANGSMTNVTKTTDFSIIAEDPVATYNEKTSQSALELSVYKGAVNTPTSWTTYDKEEFADTELGDVVQFAYDNDRLAQGRIDNIRFADIRNVLDDTDSDVLYDWSVSQEPTEDNNWQSYRFDYRYKSSNSSNEPVWDNSTDAYKDEVYTSSSIGTVPYLRAYMANVSQVLLEENKLYVTREGFVKEGGEWTYDESEYEEVPVTSSTKIIRMESNRKGFSKSVEGTETDLTFSDLRDAKNYGINCSKVLICTLRGTVRLIVIYN